MHRASRIAVLVVVLVVPGAIRAARHPTLVDVASTSCATCHADLVDGKSTVHAPAAEDCTTCHSVERGDAGTTVELTGAEPDLCVMCHDALEAAAAGSLDVAHPPVTEACTTCHDPHGSEERSLLAEAMPGPCATCHDLEDLEAVHDGQITAAVDCASCHDPHGSGQRAMLSAGRRHVPFDEGSCESCHRKPFGTRMRFRSRGSRICTACHGEFEAPPGGSLHPALADHGTEAACLRCHDPHMSENPSLTLERGVALCRPCHEDTVASATAADGHPPAAEDCLNCHGAHVGQASRLLEDDTSDLCRMCHDPTDEDLKTAHLGADPEGLDCLACHSPHGEGNPALLAANVHPPVFDGCDTCHEGSADTLFESGGSDLCLMCHEAVGTEAAEARVPHAALELDACTACHNPHAAKRARLVRGSDGDPCVACHDEQAAGEGEVEHGVIDVIGCQACHEPHGGSNPKLLRAEGDELCLTCHDRSKIVPSKDGTTSRVFGRFDLEPATVAAMASLRLSEDGTQGHPVLGHRVSGLPTEKELKHSTTTWREALSCVSCHDPHKGKSSLILRWGATTSEEACVQCHRK